MTNEHDDFDIFLRKQLQHAQPYIDDESFDGKSFTAQVMAGLPKQKKLTRWQERLIIVVPCLVIALAVLSQFPVVMLVIKAWVLLTLVSAVGWLQISFIVFGLFVGLLAYWFLSDSEFV